MQSKHSVSAIVQMVAISKDHRVKVDKELDAKGPKIPKSPFLAFARTLST